MVEAWQLEKGAVSAWYVNSSTTVAGIKTFSLSVGWEIKTSMALSLQLKEMAVNLKVHFKGIKKSILKEFKDHLNLGHKTVASDLQNKKLMSRKGSRKQPAKKSLH